MIYGFNREDSMRLKGLADSLNGHTWAAGQGRGTKRPEGSEEILLKTTTTIPAQSGGSAGVANDAKVVEVSRDGTVTVSSRVVEVYNPFEEAIEADKYITACRVGGLWLASPPSEPGEASPRIQFKVTSRMTDRQCNAVAIRIVGAPLHGPGGAEPEGSPIIVGDTFVLNDPFNVWSDVEVGGTGWAVWIEKKEVGDSENPTIVYPDRWEIETCTQPINEIEGVLAGCLYPDGQQATVFFALNQTEIGDVTGEILSNNSNVDLPPEATKTETPCEYWSITADNPHNLDGVPDSKVTIRRVTNTRVSTPPDETNLEDPAEWEAPKARSSTDVRWEIVHVAKPWARHIKVTKNGSWSKTGGEYDGYWVPTSPSCPLVLCGEPSIVCEICDCVPDGSEGYAFFDPQGKQYIVYSTNSALLGEPVQKTIVEDVEMNGCGVTGTRFSAYVFCEQSAGDITGGSVGTKQIAVADETTIGTETRTCGGGSCTWRWDYPQEPCDNGGTVTYSWSIPNQQWETSDSCPTGCIAPVPPPPADPNAGAPDEVVECVTQDTGVSLGWVKVSGCSGNCSCDPPASDGTSQGDFATTACPDSGTTESYLCVTTTYKAITVIDCATYLEGESAPVPNLQSTTNCIEISTECPDACDGATP